MLQKAKMYINCGGVSQWNLNFEEPDSNSNSVSKQKQHPDCTEVITTNDLKKKKKNSLRFIPIFPTTEVKMPVNQSTQAILLSRS